MISRRFYSNLSNISKNFTYIVKSKRLFTTRSPFSFLIDTNSYNDCVEFKWKNGEREINKKFPYIWLRDRCKCKNCYNKITDEVELDLVSIPVDIKPEKFQIVNQKLNVTCTVLNSLNLNEHLTNFLILKGQDGHESEYCLNDLSTNGLLPTDLRILDANNQDLEQTYWNRKILLENKYSGFQSFDYSDYLSNDLTLKECFKSLNKYGAFIVENVIIKQIKA